MKKIHTKGAVDLDLERKKELLKLVDSLGKDINNDVCGNYMPRVINAVEIGKKYNDIKKFYDALEGMKKSSFGGNSERQGYNNFVDNIIKKREYNINSLDFDELTFVFSWLRRVVKTKSEKKTYSNNRSCKDNSKQNNNGYNKKYSNQYRGNKNNIYSRNTSSLQKEDNDRNLNDGLFAALKEWKEK